MSKEIFLDIQYYDRLVKMKKKISVEKNNCNHYNTKKFIGGL